LGPERRPGKNLSQGPIGQAIQGEVVGWTHQKNGLLLDSEKSGEIIQNEGKKQSSTKRLKEKNDITLRRGGVKKKTAGRRRSSGGGRSL